MNEKIYVHAIGSAPWYDSTEQLRLLNSICKSGHLLSLRRQNRVSHDNFSGLDYISLCDFEKRFEYNDVIEPPISPDSSLNFLSKITCGNINVPNKYNSYNHYIKFALSFSFPKDSVNIITPKLVRICSKSARGYNLMKSCGESEEERYSDYPDEVQVKDSLSLNKINGILFPTKEYIDSLSFFEKRDRKRSLLYELRYIREILDLHNYNVSIYDNFTLDELDEEAVEKNFIKYIDKK